jgi:hypothetical protein
MHSRSNEVSDELVNEVIETDSALKVTVAIADLLIFPSVVLPEQNQCKYCVTKFLYLVIFCSVEQVILNFAYFNSFCSE